jgi:HEAT repeat protein
MTRPFAALAAALLLAAVPAAARAADSEAKKAKDQAVQAALEDYRKAPKTSDAEKTEAVQILARLEDRRLLDKLVTLAADPSPVTRVEAAKVLGTYEKSPVAAQALANAAKASRKEPDIQIVCFKSIGKVQDWSSTPVVIDFFNDNDAAVARAAIEASGTIRDPAAVPELVDLLADRRNRRSARLSRATDRPVGVNALHAEARQSLQAITGESNLRTAEDWENWWKIYGARVTEQLKKEDQEARERAKKEEAGG